MWAKIKSLFFRQEKKPQVKKEFNYMDEVEKLRADVRSLSFQIKEIPIRNGQNISKWRLIASKKEKSYTVDAESLLGAFQDLCLLLGLRRPSTKLVGEKK